MTARCVSRPDSEFATHRPSRTVRFSVAYVFAQVTFPPFVWTNFPFLMLIVK
jgi:hypothetical protein